MLDAEEECYLEKAIHQGKYILSTVLVMQYAKSAMKKSGKRRKKMNEDKNIIKNVYMEIDNITISVFMSLETLNKIKRGEYEYPFIQYTDGTSNYYYRLDLLSFISTEEEEYISADELEKTMWPYIVKKEKFPFKVMVDDNTGF